MNREDLRTTLTEGLLAAKSGKKILARIHLEQVSELDPANCDCWLWLAWTADSPDQTVEYLEVAHAKAPEHGLIAAYLEVARAMSNYDHETDYSAFSLNSAAAASVTSAGSDEAPVASRTELGNSEAAAVEDEAITVEAVADSADSGADEALLLRVLDGETLDEQSLHQLEPDPSLAPVPSNETDQVDSPEIDQSEQNIPSDVTEETPDEEMPETDQCPSPARCQSLESDLTEENLSSTSTAETPNAVVDTEEQKVQTDKSTSRDVEPATADDCGWDVSFDAGGLETFSDDLQAVEAVDGEDMPTPATEPLETQALDVVADDVVAQSDEIDQPSTVDLEAAAIPTSGEVDLAGEAPESTASTSSEDVGPTLEADIVPFGEGSGEPPLPAAEESCFADDPEPVVATPAEDFGQALEAAHATIEESDEGDQPSVADDTTEDTAQHEVAREEQLLEATTEIAATVAESIIEQESPQETATAASGEEAAAASDAPSGPRPTPIVLAVDDSPTVRKLVTMTLQANGYQVKTAANGVDAMKMLAQFTPALILLDIRMPRMDGYKLCKLIKSHDKTKFIPVVMLSGKDGLFDKLRGKLVGCDDYISKPFESADLLRHVARYVPSAAAAN